MHQHRSILALSLCVILYSTVQIYAQSPPQYTLTDLGAFQPQGIEGPWVVGSEQNVPIRMHLDTGEKHVLSHLGFGGAAKGVLKTGEAVGFVNPAQGQNSAAFWDTQGLYVPLPGPLSSVATAINDALVIVGHAGGHAMRWWPDGRAETLVDSQGRVGPTKANAIDDTNRAWGEYANCMASWDSDGTQHFSNLCNGAAFGADDDEAVGYGVGTGGQPAQIFRHADNPTGIGDPIYLPFPTGRRSCVGWDINAADVVVGGCSGGGAVVWPNTTTVVDLTQASGAPVRLINALGINDDGEIVGQTEDGRGFLLTPIAPRIAECGGDVPCQCGDTVVQDYTFTADLGPCAAQGTDAGLVMASGVTVNGNGYRISGTRGGTGILFDGVESSQVISVHVTEFATGVKMRGGASGNVYRDAWVWSHTQHGVWLDQASSNWVWGVNSVLNGASGIMLSDASSNTIGQSQVWGNPVSLHMTRADRHIIYVNGLFGDAGHAAVLDDSHGNSFYWNTLICRNGSAIILHNSDDNSAIGNVIDCPVHRDDAVASR